MASLAGARDFVDAAACGDLDELRRLLADAALSPETINAQDKDGRTAFHYACLNDDAPLLRILLADARVDVLRESPKGDTGVHMAALYAAQEALKLLFADGRCNVDAQNHFQETPLHLCAGSGDKGAAKAAALLLEAGASLVVVDKWSRGPRDVSRDNAENPLVKVFDAYLQDRPDLKAQVEALHAAYTLQNQQAPVSDDANKAAKKNIFGLLGGVKLKKTKTTERTMFKAGEGATTAGATVAPSDGRRALSKLVDFPGDIGEITRHLAADGEVDPAGADAFGLTALMKFASWNKTEYLALLIPKLSKEQLQAADPYGKTALHWAVEMASVAAVKALVAAGANADARDGKGRTVGDVLDAAEPSGVIDRLKAALVA
ncbi:ankyrin repeat-containing domain protein [Pelagophyceae sp. CCMP2097]|nr:ankyrin repeat-containing domain protein [Pelagophyceae sp. CCMP2097]|mmetsp:Transcript_3954/g.12176  ORF Transcript_3954/g.12176 Transcript_3954/m.12176 type:complete len:376 (+) Transcript_3954:130-1257(+)